MNVNNNKLDVKSSTWPYIHDNKQNHAPLPTPCVDPVLVLLQMETCKKVMGPTIGMNLKDQLKASKI